MDRMSEKNAVFFLAMMGRQCRKRNQATALEADDLEHPNVHTP